MRPQKGEGGRSRCAHRISFFLLAGRCYRRGAPTRAPITVRNTGVREGGPLRGIMGPTPPESRMKRFALPASFRRPGVSRASRHARRHQTRRHPPRIRNIPRSPGRAEGGEARLFRGLCKRVAAGVARAEARPEGGGRAHAGDASAVASASGPQVAPRRPRSRAAGRFNVPIFVDSSTLMGRESSASLQMGARMLAENTTTIGASSARSRAARSRPSS